MLAILFLILCIVFGYELVSFFVPDVRRLFVATASSKEVLSKVSDLLFRIPAAAISGITVVTFVTYFLCLAFSYVIDGRNCLSAGIFMSGAIFAYFTVLLMSKRKKREQNPDSGSPLASYSGSIPTTVFYGLCIVLFTAVAAFLFDYTYKISGNDLEMGFSVFSDLSPHTAMISSFGKGMNIPTQYMHFSGDGIKYHFLFYFFCGIMEYLGMHIDYAINIPSIIGMVCAFMLLGLIAVLLSGKRITYLIAPVLVIFRSGLNIFMSLYDINKKMGISYIEAFKQLMKSNVWFDQTPYDNWGIWAINVYANQRHLLFGVSLILIVVLLFIPHVRRLCINIMNSSNFGEGVVTFFFGKNTWIWRSKDSLHPVKSLILITMLLVCMPYFHGSCLIALLLILLGMAIFSENRLSYLIVAVCSIVSSVIQTRVFSGGANNVVHFKFLPGFVAENKTFTGIADYLFKATGFTLILAFVFLLAWLIKDIILKKPVYRSLLTICFTFPLVFAFLFQVSGEMLANHKFIQVSLILLDAVVAILLSNLFILPFKTAFKTVKLPELLPLDYEEENAESSGSESEQGTTESKAEQKKNEKKDKSKFEPKLPIFAFIPVQILSALVALCLLITLVGTGIGEWAVYLNLNKNYITVNTKSEVTEWIIENTMEDDVFLTPVWYTDRFFLAGRPTYYGWPYYAWSAGHDTNTRLVIYEWLISGCQNDIDEFRRYCKERNIKYLLLDPEFYNYTNSNGEYIFNGEFLTSNLTQVAYFPNDNGTIIYQIY